MPQSKGGTNLFSNLQPMCQVCNQKKGNRTTQQEHAQYRKPRTIYIVRASNEKEIAVFSTITKAKKWAFTLMAKTQNKWRSANKRSTKWVNGDKIITITTAIIDKQCQ